MSVLFDLGIILFGKIMGCRFFAGDKG